MVACVVLASAGCGGETTQATRVDMPVGADGTGLVEFDTDEGYSVQLHAVDMRVERVEFTVGGEAHNDEQAWHQQLMRRVVGEAHAHPNHSAGGEVGGELPGPVVFQWRPDEFKEVGAGDFLEADYAGYNLVFPEEPVDENDSESLAVELMARLEGVADNGENAVEFSVDVDLADASTIFGGALSGAIAGDDVAAVGLQFLPFDEWSGRSIFDEVDFSALSVDDDGIAQIPEGSLAYIHIRLALTSHEHYGGRLLEDDDL